MDATHSTTRYGFKVTAIVTTDEFCKIRTLAVFILQHETMKILITLSKLVEHMKINRFYLETNVMLIDKSLEEKAAVESVLPETIILLCWAHVDRRWKNYVNLYPNQTV